MGDKAMLFNCGKCLRELPKGTAPVDYARLSVGLNTNNEIEVWCERHGISVGALTKNGQLDPKIASAPCAACGTIGPHKH